jgi:multimeric flavodoxin WrbA
MKVLGIVGSPRRGGNTDLLLAEVLRGAASQGAAVKTIVLNDLTISACQHCDTCQQAGLCRIHDDMRSVYTEMEAADVIVIASPVHFMGPSAQLKAMIDRGQEAWARKYVLKQPPLGEAKPRRGFYIAVGGRKDANLFEPSLTIIKAFFRVIDVSYAGDLLFRDVDIKGAIKSKTEALEQALRAGQKLAAG